MIRTIVRVVWLWPSLAHVVWACSGPGAIQAMNRARWAGWGLWLLAAILVGVANVRARRRGVPMRAVAAGWILVMAHPGLWIPVTAGDCGLQRVQSGLLFTALAAALGIWGIVRAQMIDHADSERSPRP